MRIGFYGHSATSWSGFKNDRGASSFIDIVRDTLGAQIVNVGVPQGSVERMLFEIKKTKNLDFAFCFFGNPRYLFLPHCKRDIAIDNVSTKRAATLWSENGKQPTVEEFENEFGYGGIKEAFGDFQTFTACLSAYKEFLHHPDLHLNRFQGALVLIDQYLTARQIPAVHVTYDKFLPSWFEFKSGPKDPELKQLMFDHPGDNVNNISDLGNELMAQRIIQILQSRP